MSLPDSNKRRERLQRECEVSAAPAVLLAVACIVLGLQPGFQPASETAPSGPAEPVAHTAAAGASKTENAGRARARLPVGAASRPAPVHSQATPALTL